MKKVEFVKFQANDGALFNTQEEAIAHEKKLLALKEKRSVLDLKVFTVTKEHLNLLRSTYWYFLEGEYEGSICQNQKLPYGELNVIESIADAAGISGDIVDPDDEDNFYFSNELSEKLLRLHYEMVAVVQIVSFNLSISEQTYVKDFLHNWQPARGNHYENN